MEQALGMACDRPIFVYGTLMRGQRANHMLSGSVFAGEFQLKDYAIYHLGRYPGIKPCAGETVWGELYYVSEAMLAQMDEYEGEGDLYLRVPVMLCGEAGKVQAEAYVYNREITGYPQIRGSWQSQYPPNDA